METLALNVLSAESLITTFGTIGIIAVIFAETGLLVGFFLPGDSLLFTAGFFASTAAASSEIHLSLLALLIGCPIAAVAGAQTGYWIGRQAGPRLFERPDSRLFRREYVDKAAAYFDKFGQGRAVVLARFVPIVRTFLNPVAGVLRMPPVTFFLWQLIGGVVWTIGVLMLGYTLGSSVPGIDKYLLPAIAVIVVVSLIPVASEIVKARRQQRRDTADRDTAAR